FNPDHTQDVVYGPATTDEMANARIYYAPTKARGIVVGDPIPEDVLRKARLAEDTRRSRTELLDLSENDLNWLTEDSP
ncbi:MAG: hypothetical protein ACJATW_001128, partial [Glaciecola sp.]